MTTMNLPRTYRFTLSQDLWSAVFLGLGITAVTYGISTAAHWTTGINWLEALAVSTSYVCTWLVVRQRRFNYIFGAVSTAAYAILFWQTGLVASALLNAYLTPQLIYGWFRWRKDVSTRPVTRLIKEPKWILVYCAVTIAAYLGAVYLVTALGGQMPWIDGAILSGSILAQFLLDNKRIETWFIWAVVNILAIWTYLSNGLPLAGLQYLVFLANAGFGYMQWRRTINEQ